MTIDDECLRPCPMLVPASVFVNPLRLSRSGGVSAQFVRPRTTDTVTQ